MRKLLIALVLLVILGAGVWWFFREGPPSHTPDAAEAPPEDVIDYLASDRFGDLPDEAKADYVETLSRQSPERVVNLMRTEDLSKEKFERLRTNMRGGFVQLVIRNAREYAALGSEERSAYVDGKIDEMERMMQAVRTLQQTTGAKPKFGPPWHHQKPDADRMQKGMQKMLSDTTPQDRAVIDQYMRHIMTRAMQRGIMKKMGLRK